MRCIVLLAVLLVAPQLWAASALPELSKLAQGGARVSALVVDLSSHEILARLNPSLRLTPASVSKLYVTAATLQRWGPNHRFTTSLLSNGEIDGNVLDGDLIFFGAGDPDFDYARMWRLLAKLRQQGVTHVNGDVIINQGLFGDVACLTKDRCAAHDRTWHSYDAPLSSAGINFSTVPVTVYPAEQASQPARISLMPPGMDGFEIAGTINTVPADQPTSIWAWRSGMPSGNHIQVSGQIALDRSSYTFYLSVAHAARYTGRVLRAVAALAGITIAGQTHVVAQEPDPALQPLATAWSPPLVGQLRSMLAYSNNYMADTLTLDLAAYDQQPSPKPLTLPRAGLALEELAHRANAEASDWLPAAHPNAAALALDTGSGLSVSNKLAARDIVALLSYMHALDALAATFKGLLPVPKFAQSDRLADDSIAWSTRVAAKTGTLTEPVSVFGYAGYLRLADDDYAAFAVLVNGRHPEQPVATEDAIDAIQNDLERILANR